MLAACFEHLIGHVTEAAEYDRRRGGFPQTPTGVGHTVLDPIEESPVLGKLVLSRVSGGQGPPDRLIELLHESEA